MLLNLSNHPSTSWPESQRLLAIEQFGGVHDMPFPPIPPEGSIDVVRQMAEDYEIRIRKLAAEDTKLFVHLMGEMTFTFALVQKLKAAGIPCVASTTERIVKEREGQKIVTFNFVQFRPYT